MVSPESQNNLFVQPCSSVIPSVASCGSQKQRNSGVCGISSGHEKVKTIPASGYASISLFHTLPSTISSYRKPETSSSSAAGFRSVIVYSAIAKAAVPRSTASTAARRKVRVSFLILCLRLVSSSRWACTLSRILAAKSPSYSPMSISAGQQSCIRSVMRVFTAKPPFC